MMTTIVPVLKSVDQASTQNNSKSKSTYFNRSFVCFPNGEFFQNMVGKKEHDGTNISTRFKAYALSKEEKSKRNNDDVDFDHSITFCSADSGCIFSRLESIGSSPDFELGALNILLHKYQLMSITRTATATGITMSLTRKCITGNSWPINRLRRRKANRSPGKISESTNCQRTPLTSLVSEWREKRALASC